MLAVRSGDASTLDLGGHQFTCVTGKKVQILTQKALPGMLAVHASASTLDLSGHHLVTLPGTFVPVKQLLLYQHASASTMDLSERRLVTLPGRKKSLCTQFTCFTGTKVQILTYQSTNTGSLQFLVGLKSLTLASNRLKGPQFTCFTGTKVLMLTRASTCCRTPS